MGSITPFKDEESWEDTVRYLPDEDLLEMWVETQELGMILNMQAPGNNFSAATFEELIVHELLRRATRRLQEGRV